MGDRLERARALRRVGLGVLFAVLALVFTAALTVLIPTEGENPRAWGVVVCGVVTAAVFAQLARRNWRLLKHYRGDDLPVAHAVHRRSLHH